jgi:hypothetical protein
MSTQWPTLRSIFDVSQEVATQRILLAVDESVWDAVRIPKHLREQAAEKLAKTLDAFLSTSLTGLVGKALEGYRELARYADDMDHEVENLELIIASEHEPYVDLRVEGLPPHPVKFPLSVTLKFSGATLVISRGRVMSMRTGRCSVAGTLHCEALELYKRPITPFKVRSEFPFSDGIPITRTLNPR